MSGETRRYRYPLHIHIASVFVILVLIIGSTLAWVSYKQITRLTFDTTEILFAQTARELQLQFQKEYRPVTTSVRLLANAAIADANTVEERIKHIPILAEVIRNEPQITGFQLGYDNGDYFILRPLDSAHLREVFTAPEDAVFMADHISHRDGGDNQQLRFFLTEQLEFIGEPLKSVSDYDPRLRPWYRST